MVRVSLFLKRNSTMNAHHAYLALGTNLGNRRENLLTAYQHIENKVGRILRRSSIIETEPKGFSSENLFLNSCILVSTTLTPQQLLTATQEIELLMGRTMKSIDGVYHDRIIDIDILLYDDIHVDTPELQIPHPRMFERDFVMRPLREIMESHK